MSEDVKSLLLVGAIIVLLWIGVLLAARTELG